MGDPPFFYVRERSSAVAHHWDYLRDANDQALCGHWYVDPITLGEVGRPRAVCRACQERLPEFLARWWREKFEAVATELEELRSKHNQLAEHSEFQRKELAYLKKTGKPAQQSDPREQAAKSRATRKSKSKPRARSARRGSLSNSEGEISKRVRSSARGNPFVSRRASTTAGRKEQSGLVTREGRADPQKVNQRVQELLAPAPPKTKAQRNSDAAAAESMRSRKPSAWRLGRSPSSFR